MEAIHLSAVAGWWDRLPPSEFGASSAEASGSEMGRFRFRRNVACRPSRCARRLAVPAPGFRGVSRLEGGEGRGGGAAHFARPEPSKPSPCLSCASRPIRREGSAPPQVAGSGVTCRFRLGEIPPLEGDFRPRPVLAGSGARRRLTRKGSAGALAGTFETLFCWPKTDRRKPRYGTHLLRGFRSLHRVFRPANVHPHRPVASASARPSKRFFTGRKRTSGSRDTA